jgi:transcription initiation factor TFIIIB Brf1 subunit/transcription initiation factor TFIIB
MVACEKSTQLTIMEDMKCNACNSYDLREYHGDLTCINCGLVKYTHMVDDTYIGNFTNDNDYYNSMPNNEKSISCFKCTLSNDEEQTARFKNVLQTFNLDETINQVALEWFSDTKELKVTPKKLRYIYGVCIYCASIYTQRGISMHYIAYKLQISQTDIYKFLPRVLELWVSKPWYNSLTNKLSTHSDKLTRMLYNLSCIPSDKAFNVLKPARALYKKINNYPSLNAVKSHTLTACCIYIGAGIAGVKLQKSKFCKEVGVSMPTLKSHENMIQNVLVEMNKSS